MAEAGGADFIHVDVMDGHFVPNITMGVPVVRSLKKVAKVPLDVHLMIQDPDRYAEDFVNAGAAMLSVHVEVLPHLHRSIQYIKSLGAKAGVAINPSTPVGALEEIAGDVDHVLVMSVNPGFGAQTFIPRSESKIRRSARCSTRPAILPRSRWTAGWTARTRRAWLNAAPRSWLRGTRSSARRIRQRRPAHCGRRRWRASSAGDRATVGDESARAVR